MPDLPLLPVTAAQAARITAAFEGETDNDGNPITPQQAYRRWSYRQIKAYVLMIEGSKIDREQGADKRARLQAVESELPNA